MATQEEKDKAQKDIKKIVTYFAVFSLTVSFIIFMGIFIFDNDSKESNCEIYCNSYQTSLELLIEKVKESDENCSKYIVYDEGMDKYGEKWVKSGYYFLTDNEWSELRKYQNIHFYMRANKQTPKFHFQ